MMKNFPFKTAKSAIVAAVAVCLSLVNARTAFGQVEFLSIDDAKQSIKTEITSLDKDKASDEKLYHITDENCNNNNNIGDLLWEFKSMPVGLKVIVAKKGTSYFVCINNKTGVIEKKELKNGIYTISGKIMFKEQWKQYREDYLASSAFPTSVIAPMSFEEYYRLNNWTREDVWRGNINDSTNALSDNVFARTFLGYCDNEARFMGMDVFLTMDDPYGNFILLLSNEDGVTYLVSSGIGSDNLRIMPMAYYEKIEKALVNKQCHIYSLDKTNKPKEYFRDTLAGKLVPLPKKDQLFKCEKLAFVGSDLVGIFSNDADRFSLLMGDISESVFKASGEIADYKSTAGSSHYYSTHINTWNGEEEAAIKEYSIYSSNEFVGTRKEYPYFTDGYIGIDFHLKNLLYEGAIVPVEWEQEQNRIAAKIKTEKEQANKAIEKQWAEERKAHEEKIVQKYGEEFGNAINNYQITIGMTPEMVLAAWVFPPMNTYSLIRSNVKVDIWVYANATLSFINGKLTQIEKMR